MNRGNFLTKGRFINKDLEYDNELWPVFSFAGGPT